MRKLQNARCLAWTMAVWASCLFAASGAAARGPSMGRVGGGGARPAGGLHGGATLARPPGGFGGMGGMHAGGGMAGGMARPSMPNINRPSLGNAGLGSPSISQLSLPGPSRPNIAIASRPSLGGIGGGLAPGAGNVLRPSLPSAGTRPDVQLPGVGKPISRPPPGGALGNLGGDRPTLGNASRPKTLPGMMDRPVGGGGGIAGGGNRPGAGRGGIAGGGNRPGGGDRPGSGGIGPNRPGGGLGGGGERPGGGDRPDRPVIGGGGHPGRPGGGGAVIGDGNIISRPGWNGPGWGIGTRPGSDWWSQHHDLDHWHDHWHNHFINHHHGWYHGAWNNHWGYAWYAPVAWGAVGWGLGAWYGGYGYYNPYYVDSPLLPYDYSQPVVINNYVDTAAGAPGGVTQTTIAPPPQNDAALALFDQGLADFNAGNYRRSLVRFDATLKQLPNDPVVHEVRALAQFAVGDYQAAAAGLNALLATAPGMDWTTMAGLYGNVDDYTGQLRRLEQHCKSNIQDAAAYFVLAYHYLVTGHQEAAADALKVVAREQPKDATAKRMLDSLAPANPPESAVAASPPPPGTTAQGSAVPMSAAPQTDLVGSWQAKAGDSSIDLAIGDDSQFTWKAMQPGKPPIELQGDLTATKDLLILENKDQGSMVGRVTSAGPDKWQFALAGAPPNDPGMSFQRVK